MIPHKFQFLVFSFLMSFLMSGVMSVSMLTLESITLIEALVKWPRAWGIAMLVAFPFSLLVVPLTKRLVSIIVVAKE